MLPGFRILFALVVLSFAILIFGFSALALLRTAHQNLASQPTWQPAWRTPVEIASSRHNDREPITSGAQTLALLRVDPPGTRPQSDMEGSGVAPAPATDAPSAPSPVHEQHGDATPGHAATEVTSLPPAAAAASRDDRPISTAGPDPVAGPGDTTSAPTTTAGPADDAVQPTASNASAAPEAPQGASPPGQVVASEPVVPDPTAPKSEPPLQLAALPDATTSSAEPGQQEGRQQSAKNPDAAELRARRRARVRLRARRLALARARAAQLAQQQQATANSPFYGANFPTAQNATSAANSTPNVTPFSQPRGAP